MMESTVISSADGVAVATVLTYAAHVTQFTVRGKDVLFLSKQALFDPPKAIRGGIPIIWPQFSARGSLPTHGFARNSHWTRVLFDPKSVTLRLDDSEETRKIFPRFTCFMHVSITDNYELKLVYTVEAVEELSFTFAFHSYFNVGQISQASVCGLKGLQFQDHLNKFEVETEHRDLVRFECEVDRTYLNAPRELLLNTANGVLRLHTSSELPDAVVWNPWVEKSKKMSDFGDEEYEEMTCVEVGAIVHPVSLAQGSKWIATHLISLDL
jgi:glucose-6-phosphate 1-epimerase